MLNKKILLIIFFSTLFFSAVYSQQKSSDLKLNDLEYFEKPGLNVMVFQDIYPEGHQGALGIIQNGERVATNGDLRLEPTPGQWAPTPKMHKRIVNKAENLITVSLTFPDSSKDKKGFNPIDYPDLYFNYNMKVTSEGSSIKVLIDLDRPLPKEWIGKVGFNLEFYPTVLFGKAWYMDDQSGVFPRQANGPVKLDDKNETQAVAFASGKRLVIAPESETQRMVIESKKANLQLFDGRNTHNNGWFTVRCLVEEGSTKGAIELIISPSTIPNWKYKPVVHVSQVGYHPSQQKIATIECDGTEKISSKTSLMRVSENNTPEEILSDAPVT